MLYSFFVFFSLKADFRPIKKSTKGMKWNSYIDKGAKTPYANLFQFHLNKDPFGDVKLHTFFII